MRSGTGIRAAAALAVLGLVAAAASCAKSPPSPAAQPRVVIVTPSELRAPAEYRGAEAFVLDYPGGSATHAVFPAGMKPGDAAAATAFILALAADSRVRAIIAAPAPAGTAEAFRRAKDERASHPRGDAASLLCIAADSVEDALSIESAADLVVGLDRVYRAYLVPWEAKKMGARALVAAYSREDLADPAGARERAIMSAAAADLGLKFAAMTAPAGVDAAAFVRAGTGAWLRDNGPRTALYCSDPALVPALLAGAVAAGGIVPDAAGEASRAAYAAVLGLDLSGAKGVPEAELRLLSDALIPLGGRGRLGLWGSGYSESSVRGLGEFAMRVCKGAARKDEAKDLLSALDARSPGAGWIADYDVDPDTGVRSANAILLRQDVYVLGEGYLQSALQEVPAKYLAIGASN